LSFPISYNDVTDKIRHFQEQQTHDSGELAGDMQLEEKLSKNTAQYNKLLTEQPSNVELWLKYVQFQVFSSIICFINLVRIEYGRAGTTVTRALQPLSIFCATL
jgi:hypothetical protein